MKSMMHAFVAAVLVLLPFSVTQAASSHEVMIGFNDAFVPGGFDSASDVYLVANGLFPNGCYRFSRADVTHKTANVHEVRAYATVSEGLCIMVLVPYTKEVRLGVLGRGHHLIRFLNGDGTYMEKQLTLE
jgi:hypothetical protein